MYTCLLLARTLAFYRAYFVSGYPYPSNCLRRFQASFQDSIPKFPTNCCSLWAKCLSSDAQRTQRARTQSKWFPASSRCPLQEKTREQSEKALQFRKYQDRSGEISCLPAQFTQHPFYHGNMPLSRTHVIALRISF